MLTHPQKTDKDRANTIERSHPIGLIAQHICQKCAQINAPNHGFNIDMIGAL
jgi:hypothetical protein